MKLKLIPKDNTFTYRIDCPTPQDYELTLLLSSNTELMNYIFEKAKKRLKNKKGIDIKDHKPEEIGAFEVPEQYYNFLKVSIRGIFNEACKIFKKDGVILLSRKIKTVNFVFNEEAKVWKIEFKLVGIYTKK